MPSGEPASRHVEPRGHGWAVRRDGAEQASQLFETKQAAEERALRLAEEQGGAVIVHDRQGDVQARLHAS